MGDRTVVVSDGETDRSHRVFGYIEVTDLVAECGP